MILIHETLFAVALALVPLDRTGDSLDRWVHAKSPAGREYAAREIVRDRTILAADLRQRAKGLGWRGRVLALRVLAERREIEATDLTEALASPSVRVRVAAAVALASHAGELTPWVGLLDDAQEDVRHAALRAFAMRGAVADATWDRFLERAEDRDFAMRLICASPRRHGSALARALRSIGTSVEQQVSALSLLEGARLPLAVQHVVRSLAAPVPPSSVDSEIRRRACLLLSAAAWPDDVVELVRSGLAEGEESAERLIALLAPAQAGAIARFALEEDREDTARRAVGALEFADDATYELYLGRIERLLPSLWETALRLIAKRKPKRCVDVAIERFERGIEANLQRSFVAVIGSRIAASPRGGVLLEKALRPEDQQARPEYAALAFRSLVAAGRASELVLNYGRDHPDQLSKLIGLRARIPASFWTGVYRDTDETQTKWVAMSALALYGSTDRVGQVLRSAIRSELSPRVRRAALTSYLSVDDPRDLTAVLDEVVGFKDRDLDGTLILTLESTKRAWVEIALRHLAETRLGGRLAFVRASRGDATAARRLVARLDEFSGAEMRRLRAGFVASLRAQDLDFVFRRLTATDATADDDVWLRTELLEWLSLREDLDVGERLRSWLESEKDEDLRAAGQALLVRRGHIDILEECFAAWERNSDADLEGTLLELLGALPSRLGDAEVSFLLDLIVAPARQDPVRVLRNELETPLFGGRVEAMYPLLHPAVRTLARASIPSLAASFERDLAADRQSKSAWDALSTETLVRVLQLAARHPPALRVLSPLVEYARQRPSRHTIVDAVLALLDARRRSEAGEDIKASSIASEALEELLTFDVQDRVLEVIARDTVPGSTGPARAVLRGWCESLHLRVMKLNGEPAVDVEWANAAVRLALREDPGLLAEVLR